MDSEPDPRQLKLNEALSYLQAYSGSKFCHLRALLFKDPKGPKWYLDDCFIVVSKIDTPNILSIPEELEKQIGKTAIAVAYRLSFGELSSLIKDMFSGTSFLLPRRKEELYNPFQTLSFERTTINSQYRRHMDINAPAKHLELYGGRPQFNFDELEIYDYESLDEIWNEVFNVKAKRSGGSSGGNCHIFLINGNGTIEPIEKPAPNIIKIKLKLPKKNENYRLIAKITFTDKTETKKTYDYGQVKEVLLLPFQKNIDDVEIKLLYKENGEEVLCDKYRLWHDSYAWGDFPRGQDAAFKLLEIFPLLQYRAVFKEKLESILNPDSLNPNGILDKLNEAEKSIETHPKHSLSTLAEVLEELHKNYAKAFGLKDARGGVSLHEAVIKHWQTTTKGDIKNLNWHKGIDHVIQLNNNKKHKGYGPNQFEATYALHLTWQGINELLDLIKQCQETQKGP